MDRNVVLFALILCLGSVAAQDCENPQIELTSYVTRDATMLKHIAYIADFQVTCERGEAGNLYALLGDVLLPVATVEDKNGNYHISWTEDVKTARTGDITIPVYNDSTYAAAKKALRDAEDISAVPTFTKITINHPGIYMGPWISCEFLAVAFSVAIAYVAIHFRSQLVN